jgi:O-antigen ligase
MIESVLKPATNDEFETGVAWDRMPRLGKWLIVLVVGLIPLLGAYTVSHDPSWLHIRFDLAQPRSILALCVSLALGVAILRWPKFGILAMLAVIFTNASDVGIRYHDLPSVLQIGILLASLAMAARLLRRRPACPSVPLLLPLLVIYGAAVFISSVDAMKPARADLELFEFAKNATIVLLIVYFLDTKSLLRKAVWILIISGIILSAISIYQVATDSFAWDVGGFARTKFASIYGSSFAKRVAGPLGDPNFYAQYLAFLIPLTLYRLRDESSLILRSFAASGFVIIGTAIIFTYSRAAAVVVFFIIALTALHMRLHLRFLAAGVIAGGAMLLFVFPEATDRLATLQQLFTYDLDSVPRVDSAILQRQFYMKTAAFMFAENPIVGIGAGNYAAAFPAYSVDLQQIVPTYKHPGLGRLPHSLYLEIAAEMGSLGLTAFSAIVVVTYWSLAKAFSQFRGKGDGLAQGLVASIALAITSYLLTSVFLHDSFIRQLWVLIALAAAAARIAAGESERNGLNSPSAPPTSRCPR